MLRPVGRTCWAAVPAGINRVERLVDAEIALAGRSFTVRSLDAVARLSQYGWLDKKGERGMVQRIETAGAATAAKTADTSVAYETPDVAAMPAGRRDYGHIPFDGLPNTRDLGGLTGADGKTVRRGRLLRSGALIFGTDGDIARLRDEYRLRLVVDLRNNEELAELPDPMEQLPGAAFVHASIFEDRHAGITQEREAQLEAARKRVAESGDPVDFMVMLYPAMLMDEVGQKGYQEFFEALLACEDGAALWHCHVGRDRCGMASVLVESALGVPVEQIRADYLATNLFAPAQLTADGAASLRSLGAVTCAVEREYGDYLGYIKEALGVAPSAIRDLRARMLE